QADLFCSVVLANGQRVIALARYGLADHTAGHRRGGLELLGVIAPGSVGPVKALAIYRWLRQRRAATEELRELSGRYTLSDILSADAKHPEPDPQGVSRNARLWQSGPLFFVARAPEDPDSHLDLLHDGAGDSWQWLPLV